MITKFKIFENNKFNVEAFEKFKSFDHTYKNANKYNL